MSRFFRKAETTEFKAIRAIAMSPCGNFIASASEDDKCITVWDAHTNARLFSSPHHGHFNITDIAFSPDSKQIAMNGLDRDAVRIYDIDSGNLYFTTHEETLPIWSLCFLNNGNIATATPNGKLMLWDAQTRQSIQTLRSPIRGYENTWFNASIQRFKNELIATTLDHKIQGLDCNTGECLWTMQTLDYRLRAITITSDEKYLIAGIGDGSFGVWDFQQKILLHTFRGYESYYDDAGENLWIREVDVLGIIISADNLYFTTVVNNKLLKAWDVETGHLVSEEIVESTPSSCCCLGDRAVIGFENGRIKQVSFVVDAVACADLRC